MYVGLQLIIIIIVLSVNLFPRSIDEKFHSENGGKCHCEITVMVTSSNVFPAIQRYSDENPDADFRDCGHLKAIHRL